MSTTFVRRMTLGVAAAAAVATLASGCGHTVKKQTPSGSPHSPSASKSAPKGGGAAF
jgi:hypothetical protein